MRTVLVPGAPWPKYELPPEPKKRKPKPKPRAKPSKVDVNFERWLQADNFERWLADERSK